MTTATTGVDTLVYLYGVARDDAPDPPAELEGVDGRPVRLLRADGGLAALVSELPAGEYGEEALDARMQDLRWVGERGLAHERVLLWYAERGPVVPLHLFSLHRGDERVRERLRADQARLAGLLDRLQGRQEWGVRVWRRDDAVGEHLDELSPAVRALAEEMEQAPPGRRFLLGKKRDALRVEEVRAASTRVARQIFEDLEPLVEEAVALPLPSAAPEGGRALVLDAAFLVPEDGFGAFHWRVSEAASEHARTGFDLEFTGPWPAYHFARLDGD